MKYVCLAILLFNLLNEFSCQISTSCGNYITAFYLCCNGALVRRSADRTVCCGITTIDPRYDMVI